MAQGQRLALDYVASAQRFRLKRIDLLGTQK